MPASVSVRNAARGLLAACLLSLLCVVPASADDRPRHPDWNRRDGVAQGTVTHHQLKRSSVYPRTVRHYSVYKPAGMVNGSLKEPAALMIFLDGHAYVKEGGEFNVPAVFDNLIAAGEMPPCVGIFIDPGFLARQLEGRQLPENRGWSPTPGNRANEYDTVSDEYNRFLTKDLLPAAFEEAGIDKSQVSPKPEMHATCGSSSGGICAFKIAWFAPDEYGKVISHIGSFVDIKGGHNFPPMIRKADKKPIRIAIQDGSNDLSNQFGNWWLANQQMASAFEFKEYDYKTYWGEGGHNGQDASRVLPDELKWIWRDWKERG